MIETPPGSSSPGAQRILEAAEHLFSAHGFDAVSMSAVAERAGVSKANIYHHFKTKQNLYLAALHIACTQSRQLLQDMEKYPGTLAQSLSHFVQSHLASILQHDQISRLILRGLLDEGSKCGRQIAEQGFGENFARLVKILRAGQERGELRHDVDPAMVATLLIGANVFFFEAQDVLRHYPDVDFATAPQRYSSMLADILLRGIQAAPTHFSTNFA